MGHTPRSARDWPVPLSYHRPALRRARTVEPQVIAQRASPVETLEVGNFATFSEFLHIKCRHFQDFFQFAPTYDLYER